MTARGAGSLRQCGSGRWEVRVSLGPEPVSGRPVYRLVTVHGELADAEERRALLAAQAEQLRARRQQPLRMVRDLLDLWLSAEHTWNPSTWQGYRLAARRLAADPLSLRPPEQVSPPVLRAALRAWQADGLARSTAALHVRTLRAALGWAFDERLIASQPLVGMRGPGQPHPRRDVPLHVVRMLLDAAQAVLEQARTPDRSDGPRHQAEQLLLLLRLAADSGARRGELVALRIDDLHGRVLHIDRGVSAEVITTTKTGRSHRVTLDAGTAQLWQDTTRAWQDRLEAGTPLGPWLFSSAADHQRRLSPGALGHWFTAFVRRHGHHDVCLHRLRHTVATVLVSEGHLLQAQQRLGHAETSTTLRQYCHALPIHDLDTADRLDKVLSG